MILKPFIKTNIRIVNIKNHDKTEHDFYIGRPSIFGNPYSHKDNSIADFIVDSRNESIDLYRKYFYYRIESGDKVFIDELDRMIDYYKEHGKLNISCFCAPKRCHGDIIKEYLENKLRNII